MNCLIFTEIFSHILYHNFSYSVIIFLTEFSINSASLNHSSSLSLSLCLFPYPNTLATKHFHSETLIKMLSRLSIEICPDCPLLRCPALLISFCSSHLLMFLTFVLDFFTFLGQIIKKSFPAKCRWSFFYNLRLQLSVFFPKVICKKNEISRTAAQVNADFDCSRCAATRSVPSRGSSHWFRFRIPRKLREKTHCKMWKREKKCEKLWKPKNLKLELEFQCSFFMPT